jgi:hypothetical protein
MLSHIELCPSGTGSIFEPQVKLPRITPLKLVLRQPPRSLFQNRK